MLRSHFLLFLSVLFVLSSCKNDATIFYQKVNAIYSDANAKIHATLVSEHPNSKDLKTALNISIKEINNLPLFAEGEPLKKAMIGDITLWMKTADLSDQIEQAEKNNRAIGPLLTERMNLQTNRTNTNQLVTDENLKFAQKFRLKPLNTLVKIKNR